MFMYKEKNDNEDPQEDEEITRDQLTALDSRVQQGAAPYVDFSVWRPFGDRLDRSMKFVARILNAKGEWTTKEIAGPDAIVIEEDKWDFEPINLYQPPPLDFSRKIKNEWDIDYNMTSVAKKYEHFMESVNACYS